MDEAIAQGVTPSWPLDSSVGLYRQLDSGIEVPIAVVVSREQGVPGRTLETGMRYVLDPMELADIKRQLATLSSRLGRAQDYL